MSNKVCVCGSVYPFRTKFLSRYIEHVGKTQSPADVLTSNVFLEDCYGGRGDGGDELDVGEKVASGLRKMGHSVAVRKGTER